MTWASVMELAIGVPVAIVTTRSPWVLRRYSSFMCMSVARMEPGDFGAADVGDGAEVLVVVRFVDEQVVDPGVLECQSRVRCGVHELLHALFFGLELRFELLHRGPVFAFGLGVDDGLPDVGDDRLLVGLNGFGFHADALERLLGHDDAVPVVRRGAGDELPARGQVSALGLDVIGRRPRAGGPAGTVPATRG